MKHHIHWILCALLISACSSADKKEATEPLDAATPEQTEPTCTPEAETRCVDGHPTFIDSCGTIGERRKQCGDLEVCREGDCVCGTTGGGSRDCYGNDVYRLNDCGQPDYIIQECGARERCMNGECISQDCMPVDEACDGIDNDCDGQTDEGNLCPEGVDCMMGVCGTSGELCSVCNEDAECAEGYTCGGYQNFPELDRVCVPNGCTSAEQCPENTTCADNGLCWLTWRRECRDGNSWSIDTCNRAIRQEEDCGEKTCNNGRCIGTGTLCEPCEQNGDCDEDHLCRGYSNYDHIPMVCVPISDCHTNEATQCADGLQCSQSGVCWMTWESRCEADGDPWQFDTCGRKVVRADECSGESICDGGRCIGTGELCDECVGDGDCAAGYLCRGYNGFPEVPQICVPESDCEENPESMCAEGLQCGGSGVCWMTWTDGCGPDQIDVMNVDTCGRVVSISAECEADQHCEEGACVAGPPPVSPDAGTGPTDMNVGDAGVDLPAGDAMASPLDAGVPAADAQ